MVVSEVYLLHRDARFQALFSDKESPVYTEIKFLEERILRDRSTTEAERHYFQGKLAGILAVPGLVHAMFERVGREEVRLADEDQRRGSLRPELALLPRNLQGRGAFPARKRAARGA